MDPDVELSGARAQSPVEWNNQAKALLEDWHLRATAAQLGHQTRAQRTRNYHLLVGIPVVALTAIVGTSVFAALNDNPSERAKILAGTVTIFAAVLAGVQTFLGYAQLAEIHRVAASRYATTRRHIELAIARKDPNALDRIRAEIDKAGAGSQPIGDKLWESSLASAEKAVESWRQGDVGATRLEGEV